MLNTVIYDLRIFILTYAILIIIFSMIFAVLGIENQNIEGKFRTYYLEEIEAYKDSDELPEYLGSEYFHLWKMVAYIF